MERREVYPPFSEYQKFIQQEAEILCDPVTSSLYTRGEISHKGGEMVDRK